MLLYSMKLSDVIPAATGSITMVVIRPMTREQAKLQNKRALHKLSDCIGQVIGVDNARQYYDEYWIEIYERVTTWRCNLCGPLGYTVNEKKIIHAKVEHRRRVM